MGGGLVCWASGLDGGGGFEMSGSVSPRFLQALQLMQSMGVPAQTSQPQPSAGGMLASTRGGLMSPMLGQDDTGPVPGGVPGSQGASIPSDSGMLTPTQAPAPLASQSQALGTRPSSGMWQAFQQPGGPFQSFNTTPRLASGDLGTLSFEPNSTYAQRKLAPEVYPIGSLDALAQAEVAATKAGILSPGLAKYWLPNQLVENRPQDFAMNNPPTVMPGQRDLFAPMAAKLGLPAAAPLMPSSDGKPVPVHYLPGQGMDSLWSQDPAALVARAKAAAMFLAAKPGATPEMQIRAWNGAGPGAANHLAKVQQMAQALQTLPGNRALMQTYRELVQKYANPPPVDSGSP